MNNFLGILWNFYAEDKNGNIRGEFNRSDLTSRFDALTSKNHVTFVKGLAEPKVGDFHPVKGLGSMRVIEVSKGSGFASCTLEPQQYSDALVSALTSGSRSSRIWQWEKDNAWSHLRNANSMASGGKYEEWINPGQREEFLAHARSKTTKDRFIE
jgi:hypothetical protein